MGGGPRPGPSSIDLPSGAIDESTNEWPILTISKLINGINRRINGIMSRLIDVIDVRVCLTNGLTRRINGWGAQAGPLIHRLAERGI